MKVEFGKQPDFFILKKELNKEKYANSRKVEKLKELKNSIRVL